MSCSPLVVSGFPGPSEVEGSRTVTVRASVSVPSPRNSLAPVLSSAAAGRRSSRSRAIHSTRFDTLGKSTAHSTRDAASIRARSASLNVSPERSKVFDGTHPQYGHSPPTSSRSTTASVSPLSRRPPAIASPATPPPRHTTSNSWDTSGPPIGHCSTEPHCALLDDRVDRYQGMGRNEEETVVKSTVFRV